MLSAKEKKEILQITRNWVETFIIGLNLCPFAKVPYEKNAVRFVIGEAKTMKGFLEIFAREIEFLEKNPTTETTLVILPALGKIELFQAFMQFCEEMIILNAWIQKYQIVSFHPLMRFEGIPTDSPQQLTGIAPYPILHILRVPSVESLGAQIKKDVQAENDKKLSQLAKEDVKKLWEKVLRK
ncbi:hypothetical protein Rain11_0917 [Raineya orbicola]|jgi:hypothetical protein|uniref:DUF1415 domain-containing protein n=2 Tax=Raineya orbicola TaxID=2016530 RepID=A0A2N3IIQ6_9BACT|nr:hypothetical protein Rain11_0917 [Raineya orbicola]